MSSLSELQHSLFKSILNDEDSTDSLSWIADKGTLSASQRASIYRSAYNIRLYETLTNDFPKLFKYLGDAQFHKLAQYYIIQQPSQHPSLRYFGDGLPGFLKANSPYKDFPQLFDLALFERCLQSAFDAKEGPYLTIHNFNAISTQQWPKMCLKVHPSVNLIELTTNAVPIWMALKEDKTPPDILQQSTTWLIGRNSSRLTYFRSLTQEAEQLLKALINGQPLASALEPYLNNDLTQKQQLEKLHKDINSFLQDGVISCAEIKL